MINTLKSSFLFYLRIIVWQFSSYRYLFKSLTVRSNSINEDFVKKRILILIPHADDELIGCLNFIMKYKNDSFIELCFLNFTGSNNDSKNKINRENELLSLCETLNLKMILCHNSDKLSFLNEINFNNYDFIFVPPIIDWHNEHRLTNVLLYKSICNYEIINFKLVVYDISVPISIYKSNFHVSYTKAKSKYKWGLFQKIYKSQSNMPIKRFMFHEKINSKLLKNNSYSSELFFILDYDAWNKSLSKMDLIEENISDLKCINNIYLIRRNSDLYYKAIYQ